MTHSLMERIQIVLNQLNTLSKGNEIKDVSTFEKKMGVLNHLFGELSELPPEEVAEHAEDLLKVLGSLDVLIHTVNNQRGEVKDHILELMQNIKARKSYGGK